MISSDLYTQLIDTVSTDKIEVYLEYSSWDGKAASIRLR